MSIGESTQDVVDMENKQLELNEKEMEQMADFARDIILKSDLYVSKCETTLIYTDDMYQGIKANGNEDVEQKDGFNNVTNLEVEIYKNDNNNFALCVYTYNKEDNTGWLLIGDEFGTYEKSKWEPVEIPELKLNEKFYEQIKQDYENYKKTVIQCVDESRIISHDINQYIDFTMEENLNGWNNKAGDTYFYYLNDKNNNTIEDGYGDTIVISAQKKDNNAYKVKIETLGTRSEISDRYVIGGELSDIHKICQNINELYNNTYQEKIYFREATQQEVINKNHIRNCFKQAINNYYEPEKQITSNPKELEKMARVQGVCEAILAINDTNTQSTDREFLSKKILTEMKVTQEDCKKYAKPETYKELEKTIFKPKQEQNLEQTQGVRR